MMIGSSILIRVTQEVGQGSRTIRNRAGAKFSVGLGGVARAFRLQISSFPRLELIGVTLVAVVRVEGAMVGVLLL
jgi:hypothetical protein